MLPMTNKVNDMYEAPPEELMYRKKEKGSPEGTPRALPREKRESRPPVSGALLSHGLPPQYHRRGAA